MASFLGQLSTLPCFDLRKKLYDYTDPGPRRTLQDALQHKFGLVGGMFESITTATQSTVLGQLMLRSLFGLTSYSGLFCVLVDMLAIHTRPALVTDEEVGGGDRAGESKRSYLACPMRLKRKCRTPAPLPSGMRAAGRGLRVYSL